MKIVYNPDDGAPITTFICQGVMIDPHYPDGFELQDGTHSNGLKQYEDYIAHEILETYQFLKELTPEQAQAILSRPAKAQYKCDFPGCEFETDAKIALAGHKRSHAKEIGQATKPVIEPSLIPVAGGKRVAVAQNSQMRDNRGGEDRETKNGFDNDGVEWYGEGVQIENKSNQSFGAIRPAGKGHFVG